MSDGSDQQHDNSQQQGTNGKSQGPDTNLTRNLQTFGQALGVDTGSYELYLHQGKAAKVSVQIEVALAGRDECEEECDEHCESADELMRIAKELMRIVEHPLLRKFARRYLEAAICARIGQYGYANVVMRNGDVKAVAMWTRANLAL